MVRDKAEFERSLQELVFQWGHDPKVMVRAKVLRPRRIIKKHRFSRTSFTV